MNIDTRVVRAGVQRARNELRDVLGDLNRACIEFQVVSLVLFGTLALTLDRGRTLTPGGPPVVTTVLITFMVLGVTQLGLVSVAQTVISSRDDGTLLRLRITPGGLAAYVVEKVAYVLAVGTVALSALIIAGIALTDVAVPDTFGRWLTLLGALVLGAATATALGAILGAVLPDARESLGYAVLPAFALVLVSGTFADEELPGWARVLVDVFPFAWISRGFRFALMPDTVGTSSVLVGAAVLTAWLVVGVLIALPLLRRMTLRSAGSELARRQRRNAQLR